MWALTRQPTWTAPDWVRLLRNMAQLRLRLGVVRIVEPSESAKPAYDRAWALLLDPLLDEKEEESETTSATEATEENGR